MNDLKNVVMNYRKAFIQTHNNPDADAIASAWGMKKLIESFGGEAEIIYAGSTSFKPNITNMINKYRIQMRLIDSTFAISNDEVLIIVDGQYRAGNVSLVNTDHVIAIDHHLEDGVWNYLYKDIQPRIGACATLVFNYLKHYGVMIDQDLATVLYFGILVDTDMFTGQMTMIDRDTRRELETLYDQKAIDYLRLSSLSFDDLKIYANGILKAERYDNIIFSLIEECDDNLLGHISDLFSEIYGIDIVVVYSPRWDGYKLSIRSYHDYLTAEELVKDLTSTVGTGGGHQNKAGGYIFKEKYDKLFSQVPVGTFIRKKIVAYTSKVKLLTVGKDNPFTVYGRDKFIKVKKKQVYFRYIKISDYFTEDVTIKTLEGLVTATVEDRVIIGAHNEIYPISTDLFAKKYIEIKEEVACLSDRYIDDYGITVQSDHKLLRITKENINECGICLTVDQTIVDAMRLEERVKVRTHWGDFLAKKGDYLLVNDLNDYYICDEEIFNQTYEPLIRVELSGKNTP
ncbi:MAG TPA: hypothetical protein GXZ36_09505 [Firmicutes bacterium]|nr:hypothetical protein [Bacillota bacterium]